MIINTLPNKQNLKKVICRSTFARHAPEYCQRFSTFVDTKQMDQKYQEAIDAMNRVISGGALGMPDYERYTLLLNDTYRSSYEYTVQ